VIPAGKTSQLQPPDILIRKPFRDYLRKECKAWLISEKLSPFSKIKKLYAWRLPELVSTNRKSMQEQQ
jgi:hypothetical protein